MPGQRSCGRRLRACLRSAVSAPVITEPARVGSLKIDQPGDLLLRPQQPHSLSSPGKRGRAMVSHPYTWRHHGQRVPPHGEQPDRRPDRGWPGVRSASEGPVLTAGSPATPRRSPAVMAARASARWRAGTCTPARAPSSCRASDRASSPRIRSPQPGPAPRVLTASPRSPAAGTSRCARPGHLATAPSIKGNHDHERADCPRRALTAAMQQCSTGSPRPPRAGRRPHHPKMTGRLTRTWSPRCCRRLP